MLKVKNRGWQVEQHSLVLQHPLEHVAVGSIEGTELGPFDRSDGGDRFVEPGLSRGERLFAHVIELVQVRQVAKDIGV